MIYYFYECDICNALHPCQWDGDCRDDSKRFFADELDDEYGSENWMAVPMDEADQWPNPLVITVFEEVTSV